MIELEDIHAELAALEADQALLHEHNLEERAKALQFLGVVEESIRLRARWQDLGDLGLRARALRQRLEGLDGRLFVRLRAGIRSGDLRGEALRRQLDPFTSYRPKGRPHVHGGHENLDALLRGLWGLDHPPPGRPLRDPDMVSLELTPGSAILDLVDHVTMGPRDLFLDLGSGLGHVVMLVHLLTGASARGVELEGAYCRFARTRAQDLGLTDVAFVHADARHADLSDAAVVFMYTPFGGQILRQVLDRLRAELRDGVICTFGPCTPQLAGEAWLRCARGSGDHHSELTIFRCGVTAAG